jgi:hypothetical protein
VSVTAKRTLVLLLRMVYSLQTLAILLHSFRKWSMDIVNGVKPRKCTFETGCLVGSHTAEGNTFSSDLQYNAPSITALLSVRGLEFLTAVVMEGPIYRNKTPCNALEVHQRSGGACHCLEE